MLLLSLAIDVLLTRWTFLWHGNCPEDTQGCVCVSTWRCAAMKNDKVINVVNDKEGFLLSIGSFSQCLNEVPVLHKGHSHAKNRSTQSHSTHTRTPTFFQVNIYSYLLFYIRQILSLPHSVSPPIISHFICQTIVCVSVGMKLFNVVNSHDARSQKILLSRS